MDVYDELAIANKQIEILKQELESLKIRLLILESQQMVKFVPVPYPQPQPIYPLQPWNPIIYDTTPKFVCKTNIGIGGNG